MEPESGRFRLCCFGFQEDFLNEFFSDKLFTYRLLYFYQLEYQLNMQIDQKLIERYYVLLAEIKSELVKTRFESVHIIRSLIYYLLQKLNREYTGIHDLALEKNQDNVAFEFKKLIEIHIKEKQRINDYTNIGRSHLNFGCKCFDFKSCALCHFIKTT